MVSEYKATTDFLFDKKEGVAADSWFFEAAKPGTGVVDLYIPRNVNFVTQNAHQ